MVYLTCAVISLGERGVIKTWTEMAARVRLYMLTSDFTSLVPPQFGHSLQVRKVRIAYLVVSRSQDAVARFRTGVKFSSRNNNRGELTLA